MYITQDAIGGTVLRLDMYPEVVLTVVYNQERSYKTKYYNIEAGDITEAREKFNELMKRLTALEKEIVESDIGLYERLEVE